MKMGAVHEEVSKTSLSMSSKPFTDSLQHSVTPVSGEVPLSNAAFHDHYPPITFLIILTALSLILTHSGAFPRRSQ